MTKPLIQLINNHQIIFIRSLDKDFSEGRKLFMSKLYHSNKLRGTKAYFSTNANLAADNIFFDEYLNHNEEEMRQVWQHLLITRHLGKRFFIATHRDSELWWQPKFHGIDYLDISLTRNEYANKLTATWKEDKLSKHKRLEISLLGLTLFRRCTLPFINKIISISADDYLDLNHQYLGQGTSENKILW